MNKLAGFYELRSSSLPAIEWEEWNEGTEFNENNLWTVRTAVLFGNDISLPRAVGVPAEEAKKVAEKIRHTYGDAAMIIYYPFFVAEKSGTIMCSRDHAILEAVKDNLWELVTNGKLDLHAEFDEKTKKFKDNGFFTEKELDSISDSVRRIRRSFKAELREFKSILLEWSFAKNTDKDGNPVGESYLVFYEARSL